MPLSLSEVEGDRLAGGFLVGAGHEVEQDLIGQVGEQGVNFTPADPGFPIEGQQGLFPVSATESHQVGHFFRQPQPLSDPVQVG